MPRAGSRGGRDTRAQKRALPDCFAYSAPLDWRVQFEDKHLLWTKERFAVLIFAVFRELLNPAVLSQRFTPDYVYMEQDTTNDEERYCLLSHRATAQRSVRAKNAVRRGRRPAETDITITRLQELRLPAWVVGTRLKFQNQRWCVAPPIRDRSENKAIQQDAHQLEQQPGSSDQDDFKLQHLRQCLISNRTFVPVSRLIAFWRLDHPDREPDFRDLDASEVFACHCECEESDRARCLNPKHIHWGTAQDNIYHRVVHNTVREEKDEPLVPQARTPAGWQSPSKRGDGSYLRTRARLRRTGRKRLGFDVTKP